MYLCDANVATLTTSCVLQLWHAHVLRQQLNVLHHYVVRLYFSLLTKHRKTS